MLEGIGGNKTTSDASVCCDVCATGKVPYAHLDILKPMYIPRKERRRAIRATDDDLIESLKERLIKEREKIIEENPGYAMLGPCFVFPDHVIHKICDEATYINDVSVLNHMDCLRLEHKKRVFESAMEILSCAPPPIRRRRKK